ncbi:glycosyltransferase 87 family protein [Nocardioides sp. AE5]|uniref:glycosyltransferase 87 family protein n=1 Tax=Nocardioides sp. AE5 TaxID=2962573 RepID=UPI0028821EB6|nr:glycosyltransferase 87 family protein [Nocardioides sp. AE5]MDT0200720.1 glycosyltransferase 87 family protein [Nocardioides sp. AE5]
MRATHQPGAVGRDRGAWLLAAVAMCAGLVAMVAVQRGRDFLDLQVYRWGGDAVLSGADLYGATTAEIIWLPFTYPPFAGLLMAGLVWIPFTLAVGAWTAASTWALGRTLRILLTDWRNLPESWTTYAVPMLALACFAIQPVWSNTLYAQVNLLLMWAIVADLLGRDRRWRGALIGVAAGIKLTPLIFIALLVFTGRIREAINALLGFMATVAVGVMLLPSESKAYWTEVLWSSDRIGGVEYASNQSVNGVLARLLGEPAPTILWFLVAGAIALGVVVLAAYHWRIGDRDLAVALTGLAMLLASPISWWHHWVWVIPVAVALVRMGASRIGANRLGPGLWWLAAVWVAVFVARSPMWPPRQEGREFAWSPVEQAVGNAYVWAALVLVVGLAVRAWLTRSRCRPRPDPDACHNPDPRDTPEPRRQLEPPYSS